MAQDTNTSSSSSTLSDDERRELEQLRAEKARRLAAQKRKSLEDRQKDARIAQIKECNARMMEPDDDLHMPLAQKLVLAFLFVLVVGICIVFNLSS